MAVYGKVDHGRSGGGGQQWATMDNNGQQWATMGNNGQQWTSMDSNGQQSAVLHASVMPFFIHKSSKHVFAKIQLRAIDD